MCRVSSDPEVCHWGNLTPAQLNRVAIIVACLAATPALALDPGPPDPNLGPVSAFESASFNAGGGQSQFHFGEGSATASFTNPLSNVTTVYAYTNIAYGPVPLVEAIITNPGGGGDTAQAYGTLQYQWIATVDYSNVVLPLGQIENLITVNGHSRVITTGPAASVVLSTSAEIRLVPVARSAVTMA